MLPNKIYEIIRWMVAVFLPALGIFFATLAEAWGWELPTQAILTTLSAIELFLGAIFGVSKIVYDSKK